MDRNGAMSGVELDVKIFIDRWEKSGAAERANYQIFLSELCTLLNVAPPEPAQADSCLTSGFLNESNRSATTTNALPDVKIGGCLAKRIPSFEKCSEACHATLPL